MLGLGWLIILVCGGPAYFAITPLVRVSRPGLIYGLWYLFFLVAALTSVGLWAAIHFGVTDSSGHGQGILGALIVQLLKFAMDVESDLAFLIALFIVVVLPQWAAYGLSGAAGVAGRPRFVSKVL